MTNDTTRVGEISQQMMTNLDTKKIQLGCKLTQYKAINVCSELVDFNFGVFLHDFKKGTTANLSPIVSLALTLSGWLV